MVLSLLCTHDDVIILWVRWCNTLCSTVEGVLLVGASRTCSSVKWDDVWAFRREQVLLCTGWLRCVCNLCSGTVVVQLPLVHFYWSAPREAMSCSDGCFIPPTVNLLLQFIVWHWQFPECTCWTITTDRVVAAELYWLIQTFSANFAREMLKAQWGWKWCKFTKWRFIYLLK